MTSCNDWLDVTPQAQVSAEKIFSTPEGYESVLYGIYISMTEANAYGQNQTYGLMDVLAQYYDIYTNQSHALYQASVYNYTNGDIRDRVDAIWLNNYNTIANCNILLEHLAERTPEYFTENHYNMLKGEALAIRAYCILICSVLLLSIIRIIQTVWGFRMRIVLKERYILN